MLPVKSTLVPTVSRFLDDDWNKLFDWSSKFTQDHNFTIPPVNIQETPEHFVLELSAPGMRKEDFQIEFHDNVLTIKAEVNSETTQGNSYVKREFNYQSFSRSFTINQNIVDDENISASYQDGVLSISLPKSEEAKDKPAKTIQIN